MSTKTSAVDLVTETDQAVEALILSELQERFPSHRWVHLALRCHVTDGSRVPARCPSEDDPWSLSRLSWDLSPCVALPQGPSAPPAALAPRPADLQREVPDLWARASICPAL